MTRPKNDSPPAPKLYGDGRGGSRWMTYWTDDGGKQRTKTFGRKDDTTERQAKRRYDQWLVASWRVKDHVRNPRGEAARYTVATLAGQYLLWARSTYRKRGKPTSHVWNIQYAMRALRDLYGDELAAEFDAPKLANLRDSMILDGDGEPRAASTVNDRLGIVRHAVQWAREKGRVPREVANDIMHVRRVAPGRTKAKASKKVTSVARDNVDAALSKMPAALVDMLNLMWLTGARPGEVCDLCLAHIDMSQEVWLYVPPVHKNDHKNVVRVIPIGPKGQVIVKRYLTTRLHAPLFSPSLAHGQRLEAKRAARKTKLWPSHARRHKADPTANLSDRYTADTLRRAVHRACRAAGVPTFNPNQVRHSQATIVTRSHGKDAARALLGHSDERTTDIYLDPDVQTAMRVAREVG